MTRSVVKEPGHSVPVGDLTRLSLHEASTLVRNKEVSPVELTKACIARIEKYDSKVNAFITLSSKQALMQAQAAENEIMRGHWRGPLHGIPIALKDIIDTAGIRTTAASAVFADRVPTADAEVVRRLKKAGAVLLGKLNMNEFAAGDIVGYWGPVRNPWALDHETGSSSSGSGAAIAADFCFGVLGTDTGGSVRCPAALCGIVGLKPTYGLVSNSGVIPLCGSLDHVGPMGKTVLDTAILLQGIAGHDPNWAASANLDLPRYVEALGEQESPLRVGIPRAYFCDMLEPQVTEIFETALTIVRSMASDTVDDVLLSEDIHRIQGLSAEAAAYHKPLLEHSAHLYQSLTRKWLTSISVTGADYVIARQKLDDIRRRAPEIFNRDFDLLVMPTWREAAIKIDDRFKRLEANVGPELNNTMPFNILGLPAISVPCGFTREGLPVGLQIVGAPFTDAKVMAFAHAYEQATKWHLCKPELPG